MTSRRPGRAAPALELVCEDGRPVRATPDASAPAARVHVVEPETGPVHPGAPSGAREKRPRPPLRAVPPPEDVPILMIGLEEMGDQLHRLPPGPRLRVAPSEVTPGLLRRLSPGAIAVPLIAGGFDALDALRRLAKLGYTGRALVVCPALPVPELVTRELAEAVPGISFALVMGS